MHVTLYIFSFFVFLGAYLYMFLFLLANACKLVFVIILREKCIQNTLKSGKLHSEMVKLIGNYTFLNILRKQNMICNLPSNK